MSMPKANKPQGRLSRSPKQKTQLPLTATTPMGSGRSKKNKSKLSLAPTNIQQLELISEPLNRVLIIDKNNSFSRPDDNWRIWCNMNLILLVDYSENVFKVIKNRWGCHDVVLPINLLGKFLFHPEITNASDLNSIDM